MSDPLKSEQLERASGAAASLPPRGTASLRHHALAVAAVPRVLMLIYVSVLLAWIYEAEGGLGVMDSSLFGLHALGMSLFAVVLGQEPVLAFCTPWLPSSLRVRAAYHVVFHALGLACGIGGLVAIVYYKQLAPDSDAYPTLGNQYFPFFTLYSPHSWLGIVFLSLWVLQLALRFTPAAAHGLHAFVGRGIFVLGLCVCALGFQDMQGSDLAGAVPPGLNVTYEPFMGYFPDSTLAQLANAAVMLLAAIGAAVFTVLRALDLN